MSLMVGTKMTSKLVKDKIATVMTLWRHQLNSFAAHSKWVMELRIWKKGIAYCFSNPTLISAKNSQATYQWQVF